MGVVSMETSLRQLIVRLCILVLTGVLYLEPLQTLLKVCLFEFKIGQVLNSDLVNFLGTFYFVVIVRVNSSLQQTNAKGSNLFFFRSGQLARYLHNYSTH